MESFADLTVFCCTRDVVVFCLRGFSCITVILLQYDVIAPYSGSYDGSIFSLHQC